jgi:hypothetical protein
VKVAHLQSDHVLINKVNYAHSSASRKFSNAMRLFCLSFKTLRAIWSGLYSSGLSIEDATRVCSLCLSFLGVLRKSTEARSVRS